jgi:hypothetical protein
MPASKGRVSKKDITYIPQPILSISFLPNGQADFNFYRLLLDKIDTLPTSKINNLKI